MAEKTAKSPSKTTAKVFDIARPGKQAAAASGRPIIVTNRPIMQDPMVAAPDGEKDSKPAAEPAAASPSLPKLRLEPLDDTAKDEPKDSGEKQSADDSDSHTVAVSVTAKETSGAKDAKPGKAAAASEKAAATDKKPTADEEPAAKEEDSASTADTAKELEAADEVSVTATEEDEDKKDKEGDKVDPADAPEQTAAEPATPDTSATDDLSKPDEATAELEAEAEKQAALDKLVEDRTYFLPINAVERRRSKIMSVLGLLLIIILALALLDVMLDAGFVHIQGVQPVTHFFGS